MNLLSILANRTKWRKQDGQRTKKSWLKIQNICLNIYALPLTKKAGKPFVAATPENAANKTYPLGRKLWVYVNKQPNRALSPLQLEFIKMILSKRGQKVVIKDGYIPLSAKQVKKELAKLK